MKVIQGMQQGIKEVLFVCQNNEDIDLLIEFEVIVKYLQNSDMRVKHAQQKMHEATTITSETKEELFKMKNTWRYKLLSKLRILRK